MIHEKQNMFAKLFNLEKEGVQVLVTIDYDEDEENPYRIILTSKVEGITATATNGFSENKGDKAQAFFDQFNEKHALGFYNYWLKEVTKLTEA